jgi:plasmid stabilization system protein ParE
LLTEVQRCVETIADHPEAGTPIHAVVRRRLVTRFPYALLYTVKQEEIRILAVMNVKRRPFYWLGRR